MPPPPTMSEIESFIDYHCLQALSGKCYVQYVADQVSQQTEWAVKMTCDVCAVTGNISFWCDQLDQIAKRRNGGFSNVCRLITNSMPITKSFGKVSLKDCAITGQRMRPCFAIQPCKNTEDAIFVHHSFLSICQSIWSIRHITHLIESCVVDFKKYNKTSNLSEMCSLFHVSNARQKLCIFISHILFDIEQILTKDNSFYAISPACDINSGVGMNTIDNVTDQQSTPQ
jgi:hypothetical protein